MADTNTGNNNWLQKMEDSKKQLALVKFETQQHSQKLSLLENEEKQLQQKRDETNQELQKVNELKATCLRKIDFLKKKNSEIEQKITSKDETIKNFMEKIKQLETTQSILQNNAADISIDTMLCFAKVVREFSIAVIQQKLASCLTSHSLHQWLETERERSLECCSFKLETYFKDIELKSIDEWVGDTVPKKFKNSVKVESLKQKKKLLLEQRERLKERKSTTPVEGNIPVKKPKDMKRNAKNNTKVRKVKNESPGKASKKERHRQMEPKLELARTKWLPVFEKLFEKLSKNFKSVHTRIKMPDGKRQVVGNVLCFINDNYLQGLKNCEEKFQVTRKQKKKSNKKVTFGKNN